MHWTGFRGSTVSPTTVGKDDPKPFRWTKSADDILAAIQRFCVRTLDANQKLGAIKQILE
jgi:hypothetical protein